MDLTTTTGAKVKINPAPFADAMALKNAIAREFAASGVDVGLKGFSSETDIDLGKLISMALMADSSPVVNDAIFLCLSRCTYNAQKISRDTFEDLAAREDYYEVVFACIKANLAPFFKGLVSKLKDGMPQIIGAFQQ